MTNSTASILGFALAVSGALFGCAPEGKKECLAGELDRCVVACAKNDKASCAKQEELERKAVEDCKASGDRAIATFRTARAARSPFADPTDPYPSALYSEAAAARKACQAGCGIGRALASRLSAAERKPACDEGDLLTILPR